jgi:hypothetical protein
MRTKRKPSNLLVNDANSNEIIELPEHSQAIKFTRDKVGSKVKYKQNNLRSDYQKLDET